MSNRFRSKLKVVPALTVRPSRREARNTNGRGQFTSPLGPPSSAEGSNILAYGQASRASHSRAPGHSGAHAILRKIVPNAPRSRLEDLPGGKKIVSRAANPNRNGYNRKFKLSFYRSGNPGKSSQTFQPGRCRLGDGASNSGAGCAPSRPGCETTDYPLRLFLVQPLW